QFGTERLVRLQVGPRLLDGPGRPPARAPPATTLAAQYAAQQPSVQGAPRNDPDAVALAGGQHFQLDGARREVVQRLLTDQPERRAAQRRFLGLGDMPPREVRRPDVDDLALGAQDLHGLPDLVPRRAAVHVMHLVQVDVVGPQPPQRVLAGPADVQRGQETVVGPVSLAAVQL